MGSKVSRKLRKKLCLNAMKCTQISMNSKFVNYESVLFSAGKGDILEIKFGSISHYVLLCDLIDHNYWCFHVQRMPDNIGYGVVKYEALADVLTTVFPNETPVYRIKNQSQLSGKVLALTENSMPDIDQVINSLLPFRNTIIRFDENCCNCEHFVTLWKYGIGWSRAVSSRKTILKAIKMFRKSLAKNIFNDSCIEITNECIVYIDCNVIIHCFGLYDQKLLEGIHYVMQKQKTCIKV